MSPYIPGKLPDFPEENEKSMSKEKKKGPIEQAGENLALSKKHKLKDLFHLTKEQKAQLEDMFWKDAQIYSQITEGEKVYMSSHDLTDAVQYAVIGNKPQDFEKLQQEQIALKSTSIAFLLDEIAKDVLCRPEVCCGFKIEYYQTPTKQKVFVPVDKKGQPKNGMYLSYVICIVDNRLFSNAVVFEGTTTYSALRSRVGVAAIQLIGYVKCKLGTHSQPREVDPSGGDLGC